jgi:GNAT superfamily N-acetyltransferase
MASRFPPISFIGYPVSVPCPGHAGLGFREAGPADGPAILGHLQGLSAEDRHLRFCGTLSDAALAAHVAGLEARPGFGLVARDGPLWDGPFGPAGPVEGFADLVVAGPVAELGISVAARWRRSGVGTYLLQTAARLLALRGVERIVALTLARNAAMIQFGRACGAEVEHDGTEAVLTFPVARLHTAYLARRTVQAFAPRAWA